MEPTSDSPSPKKLDKKIFLRGVILTAIPIGLVAYRLHRGNFTVVSGFLLGFALLFGLLTLFRASAQGQRFIEETRRSDSS